MNTAALYLRLSNEDLEKGPGQEESASIRHQRALLNDYLDAHEEFQGWERIEVCDDGWSGTNFQRPGMQELLARVKKGQVQCILVKDFSRFGRDYLTVGDYVTRVFPFLGVRFISLGDGYDSAGPSQGDDLSVSFSTLIYDLYSKELSEKVRCTKDRRAKEGAFLAAHAPFGYAKDPEQKGHLVIDPEAAEIVRRVFDGICAGYSTLELARKLNEENIPTPMQYKRSRGCSWLPWPRVAQDNFWTRNTVKRMVRDERYLGRSIYGKYRRPVVGSTRVVKRPREEWIIVENTHEAIVSEETFRAAQSRLRTQKSAPKQPPGVLARKVYCACCGHAIPRSGHKNKYYRCLTPREAARYPCPEERIPETDVLDAVVSAIRAYARLAVNFDGLLQQQQEQARLERKRSTRERMRLQSRKEQTERRIQDLYEAFIEGKLEKESYIAQKESLTGQLTQFEEAIRLLQDRLSQGSPERSDAVEKYKGYAGLDVLTEENVRDLVERITIFPDGVLQVKLKFSDELERMTRQRKGEDSED